MKKVSTLFLLISFGLSSILAQGYKVGDKVKDFKLKNVNGQMVSPDDFKDAKGFIIVFTCNTCPYAIKYEDRIIALDKKYKNIGFPVLAINPNDPEVQPADTQEKMKVKAQEKNFTFPYLFDPDRKVSAEFGAMHTPQIYIVSKNKNNMVVEYIGAIDNNYKDATKANKKYAENAVKALLKGEKPIPNYTKAIGCTVKKKA